MNPGIVGARPYRGCMEDSHLAAVSLAALEILPGEPSDLSVILRNDATRDALAALSAGDDSGELVSWLCTEIDYARVETWRKRVEQVERDLNVHVVFAHSVEYPCQLARCWDAPPLLFVRGSLARSVGIGIVGSRAADGDDTDAATELAAYAAATGYSVVSGLAAGVDTAAHQGALLAGGHTVAVMGTGIRRVFPAQNAELAEQIVREHGAMISQFAPDAPRTGTTFLRRNCVIAGLVDVDVVVAGDERGGSRHQAEQAVRYGRPLLLWQPTLGGQRWANDFVEAGVAAFIADPAAISDHVSAGTS